MKANTGYVFWVAAFNVAFLFLYLVAYEGHGSGASTPPSAPAILQALNKNGLVVFLVVSVRPLDLDDLTRSTPADAAPPIAG
jgi:hypothetical protein